MKKITKSTTEKKLIPKKSREMPVTKRYLDLVKQELKSETSSLRLEMKAGFQRGDARFTEQDSKFEAIQTQLTKMMILLEDQNDNNRAVLDAHTIVYDKFVTTENRLDKIEHHVFGVPQK